jgi:hypothetical protein
MVTRTRLNVMFKRTLVDSSPRVFLVDTGLKMHLQPGFFYVRSAVPLFVMGWFRELATMICKNIRISFTISIFLSILMPQFQKKPN